MTEVVSAMFEDKDSEAAVDWLRENGAPLESITVISPASMETTANPVTEEGQGPAETRDGERVDDDNEGPVTDVRTDSVAGAGAILGFAAAATPGAGPFLGSGAQHNTIGVTGAAAAAGGALVGAVGGSVARRLSLHGVKEEDAKRYAEEIGRGMTYVGVDVDKSELSRAQVEKVFKEFGGKSLH